MNRLLVRLLSTGMVAIAMLVPAENVDAQSARAMQQLYGQGVHAYNAGQMQNAIDSLTQAITAGTRDPRVYYFRGLANAGLGNTTAASSDYSIGAQLEASSSGRHYAVGRALERVQGGTRLEIETARRNAKIFVRTQAQGIASPGFVDNSRPIIPDPVPAGQVAPRPTNFPDVTGIQNPGTPFAVENRRAPEVAAPAEVQADPFGTTESAPPQPQGSSSRSEPFGEQVAPSQDSAFGSGSKTMEEAPPKPMMEEDPFGAEKAPMEDKLSLIHI